MKNEIISRKGVKKEQILSQDELLAQFFDVLIEMDFELEHKKAGEATI